MAITIQEVIDRVIAAVPGAPQRGSVDVFKAGDPKRESTGVVTTFIATAAVIRRAAELGANLIITHEPTFFDHREQTSWLGDDPVLAAKRRLIDEHGICIWRFHDYWHLHRPDGIMTGVLGALGWEQYLDAEDGRMVHLPEGTTLAGAARHIGERLGDDALRIVGPADQPCRNLRLQIGAPGGQTQVMALQDPEVDTVLCGETVEWQTCEYARDALALGQTKGLIVVGHQPSEEAGMAYLVEWLGERVPELAITHVPAGNPYSQI